MEEGEEGVQLKLRCVVVLEGTGPDLNTHVLQQLASIRHSGCLWGGCRLPKKTTEFKAKLLRSMYSLYQEMSETVAAHTECRLELGLEQELGAGTRHLYEGQAEQQSPKDYV